MIARLPAEAADTGLRETLFDALAASETVGIAVCDREFRYLMWNRFMEELTGLPAAAVLGRNALEIYPHLREERLERVLHRVLEGETVSLPDRRYRVPGVRAGWIWVQYCPHRAADGSVAGVVGIVHEVTERKRAEEENERLAAFPREAPNPVLECDADGRVVYANPAASRLAAELGARIERALPGGHGDLVRGALAGGAAVGAVEVRVEGRILSWSYHPHPPLAVVHLFAEDVTARRAMEDRLRHEALHDPLTGLPNRRLLMERLTGALERGRRRGGGTALLFLDLDRFKLVNDSLGHPVGDQLLVAVAERLRAAVRPADTVARFGGDEFVVLLDGAPGTDAAIRLADAVQREVSAPVGLGDLEVFTTASIGIAVAGAHADGPEALLRGADAAMYRAKSRGPGRWEVYDRAMHARSLARLRMETDLRRALDRGEVTAHFQPIVSLASGRIRGVEALARWRHPARGWVQPDEFVPAAEDTGLILELGRVVLSEACRRARAWPDAGGDGVEVSVNLSVRQLAQADLVEQVRRTLEESGLSAARLRLEITESVLVADPAAAAATLRRLKELGARVVMDDFGTGYSSLAALHRLPIDGLKVDRSFVGAMGKDGRAGQVVASVLAMARGLGLEVVAEGIERDDQLAGLRLLGCDAGQGYLFSPPADADAIQALLSSDRRW